MAEIVTDENSSGAANFSGSSSNYQFDAEVGAPAVGRSISSNYIVDHGVDWNQYSPVAEVAQNTSSVGGGGGYSNFAINQETKNSSTSSPTVSEVASTTIDNCGYGIYCNSLAFIKNVELITTHLINNQTNSVVTVNSLAINTITRDVIYLLIAITLILIIAILFTKFRKKK
jgi:hypothetical protein